MPELLQQEFICCFRTIPLSMTFANPQLFASPHHPAEEPEWLKYRPNSVRLPEREDKERRTFIRISSGPDISLYCPAPQTRTWRRAELLFLAVASAQRACRPSRIQSSRSSGDENHGVPFVVPPPTEADASSGLGLCQQPPEAMIASASFGPQLWRL